MDLALNNLQRLICHKTQTTNQPNTIKAIFFLTQYFDVIEMNIASTSRISYSFILMGKRKILMNSIK